MEDNSSVRAKGGEVERYGTARSKIWRIKWINGYPKHKRT